MVGARVTMVGRKTRSTIEAAHFLLKGFLSEMVSAAVTAMVWGGWHNGWCPSYNGWTQGVAR